MSLLPLELKILMNIQSSVIRPVSIMLQNLPIMLFSISQFFAYYAHFYASRI